jgi:guanyl-specific ribonuclease Sa
MKRKWQAILLSIGLCLGLAGCDAASQISVTPTPSSAAITEDGTYDSAEDVSLYLMAYNHLPDNYMTKAEAREEGWEGGALSTVIPGMCIGGDVFGNFEGILPEIDGRTYYECDIDTLGQESRGEKRLIYSEPDLNIYYTEDHYETFTHLYGDDANG